MRSRAWLADNGAVAALGAALVASVALLLAITHDLTFFQDTWSFLMNRRELSADALFAPHNEHIVVVPVAIELVLIHLFGMDSATPEFVVLTLALAAAAILLFVYVRRRLGPWPALMAAALLLFLGPAWQDILWPFEIGFVGSILFGIAMLLALERRDRGGDVCAALFLVLSIGFSSVGIAFIAGAAVDVLQQRRARGLVRAWVFAVPALLFLAWYLGWGHEAETHLALQNVLASPQYVAEALAGVLESLFGLSTIAVDGTGTPEWGRVLLVGTVALLVYGQVRRPGFSPYLWPVAATAAAYWLLGALNYIPGREPYASRYMYAGAALVLLLAANLLQGVRFSRRALLVAGAVVALACLSNLATLREGRDWFLQQTVYTRADLAAIEIARRTVDPSFRLTPELAGTPSLIDVSAGEYLEAEREHGSPAYTPAELAGAPEYGRARADVVLAYALPVSAAPLAAGEVPGGRCRTIAPGEAAALPGIPLGPGAHTILPAPGPDVAFSLRRFAAESFSVPTEGAAGGSATRLVIPADSARLPWRLQVEAEQPVRLCR